MKKLGKYIGLSILTLLIFGRFNAATAQNIVDLRPDQTGLVPGTLILVPVLVTATLASAELYFTYDKDVLTPASPWYSGFDVNFTTDNGSNNPKYNPTTSSIIIYSVDGSSYTLSGTPIVTLRFIYNGGGSTSIHMRKSPDATPVCKLFDDVGTQITPVTYYDANMSGSGYTYVKSKLTGASLPWSSSSTWFFLDNSAVPAGFIPTRNVYTTITGNAVTMTSAIDFSLARCKDLTINPGGKLTLNSGISANINGNLLLQGVASGSGSFIDLGGTLTVTGSTTVQRQMTGDWVSGLPDGSTIWHGVSSPVQGQSNNIFNGSLMNSWNEVTQNWDALTMPYITMNPGKGFIVAPTSGGITATFTGTLNTGTQTISGLTKTGSTTWSGFNLVGNPFPSAILWNSSITGVIGDAAWLWNGSAYIAKSRISGDGIIPAEQGFFVQASSAGSMIIPSSVRNHYSGTPVYYKSGIADLLTLKVEGNGYWDQTQVRILPESSDTYNMDYDALKFPGNDAAPQLFTYKQDLNISILSVPTLSVYPVIMVGFKPGANGNFTITASDLETFAQGTNVYLEDLLTGTDQDLQSNPIYTFSAAPGQQEHRFNLHFAALGVPQTNGSNLHIYSNEKNIYVNIPLSLNGDIVVYNIMGVEVSRKAIVGNSLNILNTNLSTGYYIVKVLGDTQSVSNKVFIR